MPGLIRGMARTAAVVGTATAVSNGVSRRQASKWDKQAQEQQAQQAAQQPVAAPAPAPAPATPEDDMSAKVEALKQLAQLKDQGILTDKYLRDIPEGSRAEKLSGQFHWGDKVSEARVAKVRKLNELAKARGQSMAQMAIAWVLRHKQMTSALIGASRVGQIEEAVAALATLAFSTDELAQIEAILAE